MSMVYGQKKCPQCGGEMQYEFDCNTAEEGRSCLRCGFRQEWFLLRNPDGTIKTDDKGIWVGDYEEEMGYGVENIQCKDGRSYYHAFRKPLSDEEKADYRKKFPDESIEPDSYVVVYNPETKTLEAVIGTAPGEFKEI